MNGIESWMSDWLAATVIKNAIVVTCKPLFKTSIAFLIIVEPNIYYIQAYRMFD